MKLVSVATHLNRWSKDWEDSAEQLGYDFKVLGVGVPWTGFGTKMQVLLDYITSVDPDDLIVLTDCYDVIMVGSPEELENKFKAANRPIIMGAEKLCSLNCEKKAAQTCGATKKNKHVNTGFMMGKAKDLAEAITYANEQGNGDDQLGAGRFWMAHCDKVHLDSEQEFVANIYTINELQVGGGKRFMTKHTSQYPVVLHMPGMYNDLGKRSTIIRSAVLPSHVPASKGYYLKMYVAHIYKYMWNPVYVGAWLGGLGSFLVLLMVIVLVLSSVNVRTKK